MSYFPGPKRQASHKDVLAAVAATTQRIRLCELYKHGTRKEMQWCDTEFVHQLQKLGVQMRSQLIQADCITTHKEVTPPLAHDVKPVYRVHAIDVLCVALATPVLWQGTFSGAVCREALMMRYHLPRRLLDASACTGQL
jgi:hypothetical protein